MKLLAGIVQLLLLQSWNLMMGRAMPVNSPSCEYNSSCNDIAIIVTQIQNKIREMNAVAQNLSEEYVSRNGFSHDVKHLCNPKLLPPTLNIINTSKEHNIVDILNMFIYVREALSSITEYQKRLNDEKSWIRQLNNTVSGTKAVIYNLSCLICKKYNGTQGTGNYNIKFPTRQKELQKKVGGCRVVMKYKDFISQAAEMDFEKLLTSDKK
ncbi:uncharacterized protein RCH25_036951 [Pelodytes ibericus]